VKSLQLPTLDIPELVRNVIAEIGYEGERGGGFDARTCAIITAVNKQSPDIAHGVSEHWKNVPINQPTTGIKLGLVIKA